VNYVQNATFVVTDYVQ